MACADNLVELIEHDQLVKLDKQTCVDIAGSACIPFLRWLLTNDVAQLKVPGQYLSTALLNEQGELLFTARVYYFSDSAFRLVFDSNHVTAIQSWLERQEGHFDVQFLVRDDLHSYFIKQQNSLLFALIDSALSAQKSIQLGDYLISHADAEHTAGLNLITRDSLKCTHNQSANKEQLAKKWLQPSLAKNLYVTDTQRAFIGSDFVAESLATHGAEKA